MTRAARSGRSAGDLSDGRAHRAAPSSEPAWRWSRRRSSRWSSRSMLVAALVRCGALAPDRAPPRIASMLANANGFVVLVSLFAAARSCCGMLTPRSGLPLFFVDVLPVRAAPEHAGRAAGSRAAAAQPGDDLGSALVLKFVVLAALSGPAAAARRACWWRSSTPRRLGASRSRRSRPGAGTSRSSLSRCILAGVSRCRRRGLPSPTALGSDSSR